MSETCVQNANAKPTTTTTVTATTSRQQSTISSEKVDENKTEKQQKEVFPPETIVEWQKNREKNRKMLFF